MSQIKSLLIHIKDMLIDVIEKILLPRKYGRNLAVVKVSQGRMIAIDGIQRIRSAGSTGRQIIRFCANGFQFGTVKSLEEETGDHETEDRCALHRLDR
jgi:hypothetical protein